MRLFAIRDTSSNTLVPDQFFPNKPAAKRERNRLNGEHNSSVRFVVTPGPDHQKRTPAKVTRTA